jgi:hypothetical protein
MKTAVLLVLGLILGSLAAVGQTLQETTDWMHSFTDANPSWQIKDATGDNTFTSVLTFKDCQATQTTE